MLIVPGGHVFVADRLTRCSSCPAGKYSSETGQTSSATCSSCPAGKYSQTSATCSWVPVRIRRRQVGRAARRAHRARRARIRRRQVRRAARRAHRARPARIRLIRVRRRAHRARPASIRRDRSVVVLIVPAGQVFVGDRSDEQRDVLIVPGCVLSGRSDELLIVPVRQVFVADRSDVLLIARAARIREETGQTSSATCSSCPAGTYSSETGQTSSDVLSCPAGTYSSGTGRSWCSSCPAVHVGHKVRRPAHRAVRRVRLIRGRRAHRARRASILRDRSVVVLIVPGGHVFVGDRQTSSATCSSCRQARIRRKQVRRTRDVLISLSAGTYYSGTGAGVIVPGGHVFVGDRSDE